MGLAFSLEFLWIAVSGQWFGDAHIFWFNTPTTMYLDYHVGYGTGYAYAPAFAQLIYPLHALPWPVFSTLWSAMLAAVLWWLLRGTPRGWWLCLALLALPDVLIGNVHLLVAAAIVVGFTVPASWTFILLTKVPSGAGLLWFAVRREWRPLATALLATAIVVAISLVLDPGLWRDWTAALWENRDAQGAGVPIVPGLIVRGPLAVIVAILGARKGWRWTVLVAALIALPHIWIQSAAMFAGLPRLLRADQRAGEVAPAAMLPAGTAMRAPGPS
ncbi:MAG TPA: glycosyltransferase family 87 protein [Candidatus Limnocylindrales bacterium]|nr:glycosyltransferase family 87 protein [Candidatus Limnocylindrales bacterium]